MPTISTFYGIMVVMYLRNKEHNPPHVHAIYGEYDASFYILDGELYEGDFPLNGKKLMKEFINKNRDDLLKMWEDGIYKKLPAIK